MSSHNNSRGSYSSRQTYDTAQVQRLRSRLRRSGAIVSSRSALSFHDAQYEEEHIVDVGDNREATLIEHLLARLEQHGLRRCLSSEEDATSYMTGAGASTPSSCTLRSSHKSSTENDSRDPYYYLCVPCELRLTPVSTVPATQRMLEDAHYHFSSASHRRVASWMADPDIDFTLSVSPVLDAEGAYVRIYVNGVSVLVSRKPGGGDMFYYLPHELEQLAIGGQLGSRGRKHCVDGVEPPMTSGRPDAALYSASGEDGTPTSVWYHPQHLMFTRTKQIPIRISARKAPAHTPRGRQPLHSTTYHLKMRVPSLRRFVTVTHVPLDAYIENTLVDVFRVPLYPIVVAIKRRRLSKRDLARGSPFEGTFAPSLASNKSVEGHMLAYIQTTPPLSIWNGPLAKKMPNVASHTPMAIAPQDSCVVQEGGSYRVVLVSEERLSQLWRGADANIIDESNDGRESGVFAECEGPFNSNDGQNPSHSETAMQDAAPVVPLTQELLDQLGVEEKPFHSHSVTSSGSSMGSARSLSNLGSSRSSPSSTSD